METDAETANFKLQDFELAVLDILQLKIMQSDLKKDLETKSQCTQLIKQLFQEGILGYSTLLNNLDESHL